jgi:hypothetical protein
LRIQPPCLRQITGAMMFGGRFQQAVDDRDGGSSRPDARRPHLTQCAYTTVTDRIFGCTAASARAGSELNG